MDKLCQVCHDAARGSHFGVVTCSACSAFFRRTVSKDTKHKCLHRNSCEILSTIRNICRSCRFRKCLAVGMRKDAVQKFRDVYGKREKPIDSPSTSFSVSRYPIMDRIVNNYIHLEQVRQVIHRASDKSVFQKHEPRPLNYKETVQVFLKELHLINDWVINSFSNFTKFPDNQKKLLLNNFYLQMIILEGGYFCCRNGRSDVTFLPSGDYIDCENPESYYYDPDGQQPISAEEAAKLFASSFENYRRNVTYPMMRDNVDRFEFLALAALTVFDTGLENQTDECMEVCRETRAAIQRELLQYYSLSQGRKEEEASIRLGHILSILPNLQRAARRFHEDMTLSNVMNAYSVDEKFYKLGMF